MFLGKRYSFMRLLLRKNIVYKLIILSLIMPLSQSFCYAQESSQKLAFSQIQLEQHDRILILAPHPDDEILGCGGIIQRAKTKGLPLKIVFLTYGDNNQWSFIVYRKHPVFMPKAVRKMGLIRYNEALEAAKVLGVLPEQLIFLGYPDYRTLTIWYTHWAEQPPAKSMLSRVAAVPYLNAFRPGALHKGEEIVQDLENIFREFKPTKIFLSHPADHNPDHRALYLFTRIALWGLNGEIKPALYPYLIHFRKWPQLKGYKPKEQMIPPSLFEKEISWEIMDLNPEEVETNNKAVKKHRSQYISSPKYLQSFIRSNELFGDFPEISFSQKNFPRSLARHAQDYFNELPEELIDEERIDFIGIEDEFISFENKALVFTLRLSRPVGNKIRVSLYVFGYREDRSFKNMPKLHVMLDRKSYHVYDQEKLLQSETVNVDRKANEITIRIPLEAIRDPGRILTSARTYRGSVPLDWVEWRILKIEGNDK